MSNEIKIDHVALVAIIAENASLFGDAFHGIYADVNGGLDCCEKSNSGDSVAVITFSGMGDFVDDSGRYTHDALYDSKMVAECIVYDAECLERYGIIYNDAGDEIEYSIVVEG
jgi:hypothetical protein